MLQRKMKDDYIKWKQSQIDFAKKRDSLKRIVMTVLLAIIILVIVIFCTSGFQNWNSHNIELLSVFISILALVIASWAFFSQKSALDFQIAESKQAIADMAEYQNRSVELINSLNKKCELEQSSIRLHMLQSYTASLVVHRENTEYRGQGVFEQLFLYLPYCNYYREYKGLFEFLKGPGDGSYTESESIPILSPYFRLLNDYIDYVDSCASLTGEDKNSYVSILINSLTKFELIFLYYHGLMHESASLRKLIEKYHILENIDFEYVIADNNVAHYEESAFGRNGRIYSEKRKYEISQWPCNRPSESK